MKKKILLIILLLGYSQVYAEQYTWTEDISGDFGYIVDQINEKVFGGKTLEEAINEYNKYKEDYCAKNPDDVSNGCNDVDGHKLYIGGGAVIGCVNGVEFSINTGSYEDYLNGGGQLCHPNNGNSCGDYDKREIYWSNCELNSNLTQCTQNATKSTYRYGPSGTIQCDGSCTVPYKIDLEPALPQPNTVNITFSTRSIINSDVYANNKDEQEINVIVNTSNTINGKKVIGFPTTLTNFSSNIKSNIVDGTGSGALSLNTTPTISFSVQPPNGTLTTLKITSTTPLETTTGQLKFQLRGNNVTLTDVKLNYLKPFIGQLEANNPTTGNRDGIVTVGTLNKYRLKINQKINFTSPPTTKIKILNGEEQEFKDTLKGYGNESSKITLSEKKVINTGSLAYNITGEHNIEFETRLNTTSGATTMPKNPGIQLEKPIISYTLDNKEVKYYLGTTNLGDTINQESIVTEINPIALVGGEFIGVRVIGGIQGGGNSEFTGQKKNISSISSLESRTQIRKNAYTYTNSMTDGQIVNGVKYVDLSLKPAGSKNYEIEENPTYETLVVKNGNVIIDGDLNTNNKVLGIIVLRDGFNVQEDYKTTGNVYVLPNVQKINAIIYADGGLISIKGLDADNKAILYNADSTERTQNLNKQLYMNGSLFTRNTIGGAVLTNQTNGEYTLPGGGKTTDFNLALQYDLNYTRRGNLNCNNAGGVKVGVTPQECTYDEPFIIKYDSRIQTNPPKLFGN